MTGAETAALRVGLSLATAVAGLPATPHPSLAGAPPVVHAAAHISSHHSKMVRVRQEQPRNQGFIEAPPANTACNASHAQNFREAPPVTTACNASYAQNFREVPPVTTACNVSYAQTLGKAHLSPKPVMLHMLMLRTLGKPHLSPQPVMLHMLRTLGKPHLSPQPVMLHMLRALGKPHLHHSQ